MAGIIIPFIIGLAVAVSLYLTVGWWGFLVVFPWIGMAISLGLYIMRVMPRGRKSLGRKITILIILPVLLIFVPVVNRENFQLEGVVLLVLIGYFNKGVIHYAVAKVFGPVIWGRGFCGWACWTAAVLDWLPVGKEQPVPPGLKKIRYLAFLVSVLIPVAMVFFWGFDVRGQYLKKNEMVWMFAGNAIYYIVAVFMAFAFKNRRAFCKIACPVAVVMAVPSSVSLITISPSGQRCRQCSLCNKSCPMDVDVMSFIARGKKVRSTECVLCMECKLACPAGAIK